MKKRILITGATGFIGRNLKEQLEKEYHIKAPTSKELDLWNEGEVCTFLQKNNFDVILHCATHNETRTSPKDLRYVFYGNLRMFFNLARWNDLYGRMFYFGSGAEYDMRYYIPKIKEDYFDTHVPVDDYGFSKYIMAKYIGNTQNIYDLRLFGCFGRYEDYRIRFISNAICRTLFNLDITISQNVYFDYLYINDLARIMRLFIERKTIQYRCLNICTGRTIDLKTLAKIVLAASGKKLNIKVAKQGLKKEYSGDNGRLMKEIGGFLFTPIDRAVWELYGWYKKNRSIIDPKSL